MERISLSKLTHYFNDLDPNKSKPDSVGKAAEINLEVFYRDISL